MKRSTVGLAEIADLHNLAAAFYAAAQGKRGRGDVEAFRLHLDRELAALRTGLLAGTLVPGPMRRFRIHDPKPRLIHAPGFRDRVLHHAIMAHVGPVLDRALVFDTYACRPGKGTLAAVQRAGAHAIRHDWFTQIDVRAYFASIDHAVLLDLLGRKFKDPDLLRLLASIIGAHEASPGCGLPIGTLTSQHFANFYLAGVDRLLLEAAGVPGFVRYMDDLVWWTDSRAAGRAALDSARHYLAGTLHLEVKQPVRIGRTRDGLNFCGFRLLPGRTLLSRRRRRCYTALRQHAERACLDGQIGGLGLQSAYACALALTVHADAAQWRREQLRRRPVEPTLEAL
jgi:retron-type reverse transcriptase